MIRLSRKTTALGLAAGVAGAVAAVAVASVDGVASSPTPLAVAAAPRLVTTVVHRDVRVDGGVGEISCPKKTLRGGPVWVPVGGGVAPKLGYALDRSFPSIDAYQRRGWTAKLTQLPSFLPLGGRPQQQVTTTQGLYPGPWGHSHHVELQASLAVKGPYADSYPTLNMYVVCASLAGAGTYRLSVSVARRDVEVDTGVGARIGCLGAVAGGVVGDTGFAVRGSFPALNSQGLARGWSGALEEFPRTTIFGSSRLQQTVLSDRRLASYWVHRHHITLPGNLLVAQDYKGYGRVRVSVVCATIRPATGVYRLNTQVVSREVPANGGVGQIFCPNGSMALGGGVVGKTGYAVGSSYPLAAKGQATGWAGSLAELPPLGRLGNGGVVGQTVHSDYGLNGTIHQHRHDFQLPASLLTKRDFRGYSSMRMYVVCATLGGGAGPLPVGVAKTPRLPVTTTTSAPPAPPKTTTAPTTTTTPKPPTTTTTPTTTSEQQLPDLVVRKVALDSSTLVWNIEIRNRGNGDAPASKTGLTSPPGSDERRIDTPPIGAGDSVTVTAECPYGSIGKAAVRADAKNDVQESDEGNNGAESPESGVNGRCRFP